MAATTNRRFTELYRNSSVYQSKQAAITGLYDHGLINSLKDGEPVLARYMAYFVWDDTVKQYVFQETKDANKTYTFTRLVSNETSETSTKEYIVGDIINVTTVSGNTTTKKSYKCTSLPSGEGVVVVPINTNFASSGYFTEITGTSVSPQNVETIRVLMGVATVFDENNNNNFKKNPPQGKITFFEEDDVIKELINNATITSPDGTIVINNTVSGKEVSVNLGNTLVKDTTSTANKGKINVNIDNDTLVSDSSTGVISANLDTTRTNATIEEKTHVPSGETDSVSDGYGVKHDTTVTETASGVHVNIDEKTLVQDSNDSNKIKVNAGSSLDVDSTTGEIDVNVDNETIKISDVTGHVGELYANIDNNTLVYDSTNGIEVDFNDDTMERKAGAQPGEYDGWGVKHDDTISVTNDGLHVKVDDKKVEHNSNGELTVKHNSTIILDSHTETEGGETVTVYDGIGVNIDNKTITQIASGADANKLAVKHGTTITDDANGIHTNIDNLTLKQYASGDTIPTGHSEGEIHVNIDNDTLVSDGNGVISVDYSKLGVYGEKAIVVETHQTSGTDDGKTVKLVINDTNNVLNQGITQTYAWETLENEPVSQTWVDGVNSFASTASIPSASATAPRYLRIGTSGSYSYRQLTITNTTNTNGLSTNFTLRKLDPTETTNLGTNVKEAYKLVGLANGTETAIGDTIKIYKDSSLKEVYLGHVGDSVNPTTGEVTKTQTGNDALCFVYQLADGTYTLVAVDVESFLAENEFKNGLQVTRGTYSYTEIHYVPEGITWDSTNSGDSLPATVDENSPEYFKLTTDPVKYYKKSSNGEVSARLGDGLQFNASATEGQKPIEVKTGDGIQINSTSKAIEINAGDGLGLSSGTSGQKSVEVKTGNGIQINSTSKVVESNIGDGLQFGSGDDGAKPIEVNTGDGIQINSSTNAVEVKTGNGIQINSTSKAVEVKYGQGIELDTNNAIKAKVNTNTPLTLNNNGIGHSTSTATAGTYGPSADVTIDGTNMSTTHTIDVPNFTIDAYGHITAAGKQTLSITIPEGTILNHTEPTWETNHISSTLETAITQNKITVGEDVSDAVQALDNKIAAVEVELAHDAAALSQAIEDETRYYAKSSTAASTAAKTATVVEDRHFTLINGTSAEVYFSTASTASNVTLNINDTGAKSLVYNDQPFDGTLIEDGTTLLVVYDAAYNSNAGCYRVVGGVGSGSGTSGITKLTDGAATDVINDYTEVNIHNGGTTYGADWFENTDDTPSVITPDTTTVYRVITSGNFYNKAYKWNGTRYVVANDVTQHVDVKVGQGLNIDATRNEIDVKVGRGLKIDSTRNEIDVNLTTSMYNEEGTAAVDNVDNMLKLVQVNVGTQADPVYETQLTMTNTWDCGTY